MRELHFSQITEFIEQFRRKWKGHGDKIPDIFNYCYVSEGEWICMCASLFVEIMGLLIFCMVLETIED
jgi:hypothetical protein